MIEASFEAVVPKVINAEFEAVIPREKAFDIVNKDIHIDTNGKYEVKADAGTAMTQVNVEVEVPTDEYSNFTYTLIDETTIITSNYKTLKIHEGVESADIRDMYNLEQLILPSTFKILLSSGFMNLRSIKNIELPKNTTILGMNGFHACGSLESIYIPANVIQIQPPCFGNCISLAKITVDPNNAIYDSRNDCNSIIQTDTDTLAEGGIASTIPEGIKIIGVYAFRGRGPERIVFPKSVTRIETNAFNTNLQTFIYDFRNHEVIPTLANTNAFTGIPATCKIVVPDALYDQWIVATNWATYKSRIVKASEFVEPTN